MIWGIDELRSMIVYVLNIHCHRQVRRNLKVLKKYLTPM
jgi:hypothetical protein